MCVKHQEQELGLSKWPARGTAAHSHHLEQIKAVWSWEVPTGTSSAPKATSAALSVQTRPSGELPWLQLDPVGKWSCCSRAQRCCPCAPLQTAAEVAQRFQQTLPFPPLPRNHLLSSAEHMLGSKRQVPGAQGFTGGSQAASGSLGLRPRGHRLRKLSQALTHP